MSLARLALAALAVAAWFLAWTLGQRRIAGGTGPLRLQVDLIEAALLTAFAALWSASLGHGGWWVLFTVIGLLTEGPIRWRHRPELAVDASQVRPLLLGTIRILVAGLVLSRLL